MGSHWSLATSLGSPGFLNHSAGPSSAQVQPLCPGPAALPALGTATPWSQGQEQGEPCSGLSSWKEAARFVGISPVPATQKNEQWQPRAPPGLLSSLTEQGRVPGLVLTLGVAAWERDRLGSDSPESRDTAGTPLFPVLHRSL